MSEQNSFNIAKEQANIENTKHINDTEDIQRQRQILTNNNMQKLSSLLDMNLLKIEPQEQRKERLDGIKQHINDIQNIEEHKKIKDAVISIIDETIQQEKQQILDRVKNKKSLLLSVPVKRAEITTAINNSIIEALIALKHSIDSGKDIDEDEMQGKIDEFLQQIDNDVKLD